MDLYNMANIHRIKLNEHQYKLYKKLLNENQEGDSINKAIKYAEEKMGLEHDSAVNYVRVTFRGKIHACRTKNGGKYILGALRLYNEEVKTEKNMRDLERCIKIITENEDLYKKYNKDLNGLHLNALINELKDYKLEDEKEVENSNKSNGIQSDYKIVSVDTFDICNSYSDYVSWCVTKNISTWQSYTNQNTAQFYFALKPGFETLSRAHHENEELLGEYGLSMLAICVNPDGSLKTCTCRWNHDKGGNDHCMNVKQIEEVIKCDFRKVFKPNEKGLKMRKAFDEMEERIFNAKIVEDIDKIYDDMGGNNEYNGMHFTRYYRNNLIILSVFGSTKYAFYSKNTSNKSSKVQFIKKFHNDNYGCESYAFQTKDYIFLNDDELGRMFVYDKETLKESNNFGNINESKYYYDEDRGVGFLYINSNKSNTIYSIMDSETDNIKKCNISEKLVDLERVTSFEPLYEDDGDYGEYLNLTYIDKNGKDRCAIISLWGDLYKNDARVTDIILGDFFKYQPIGDFGLEGNHYVLEDEDIGPIDERESYGAGNCCIILSKHNKDKANEVTIVTRDFYDNRYTILERCDEYEVLDLGDHYVLVLGDNNWRHKSLYKINCSSNNMEDGVTSICEYCNSYKEEPMEDVLLAFKDTDNEKYIMFDDYSIEPYSDVLDRYEEEWTHEYDRFVYDMKVEWQERHDEIADIPEDELDKDDIKYREDFDIDNFMDDYENFEFNCREYELYIAMDNIFC